MKAIKFLALMMIAMIGMTACDDDDPEPTPVDNVENGEKNDSTATDTTVVIPVNHEFKGYIFVSSRYFANTYYGNEAVLKVYTEDNQYIVEFHDPQWGDVTFKNVQIGAELSATDSIGMDAHGTIKKYEAVLSGPMRNPVITVPSVMGGTVITFYAGEAPLACQLDGSHAGINQVMVGSTFGPYDVNTTFRITANADGTINVTMPEYDLKDLPQMGDMTIGKLTVSNIAYDEEKEAFYRVYGADSLTQHCKSASFDADYALAEDSYIEVKNTDAGLEVTNSFRLGRMPFPIAATFKETVAE